MRRWSVALLLGACLPASACFSELYPSVHFNGRQPDFGAAPPRWSITSWGMDPVRPTRLEPSEPRWSDGEAWRREAQEQEQVDRRLAQGRAALLAGRFAEARQKLTGLDRSPHLADETRPELVDSLELLGVRAPEPAMKRYFEARELARRGDLVNAMRSARAVASDPAAGPVRAHAGYLIGAIIAERGRLEEAASEFEKVAKNFPTSPRRLSALIMIPRVLLRGMVATDPAVLEPLPDEARLRRASAALQQLLKSPNRFAAQARLWQARIPYLRRQFDRAFDLYLRAFAQAKTGREIEQAVASARYAARRMTEAQATAFRSALADDQDLMAAYIEYRFHYTGIEPNELAELARFALDTAESWVQVSNPTAARIAEMLLARGELDQAFTWADMAVKTGGPDRLDLARYVRAGTYSKRGEAKAAEADYAWVAEQKESDLAPAARENLAIIFERQGRWAEAFEQYRALGYGSDVAYLIDARLTLEELEQLIARQTDTETKHRLTYSLGVRLLRDRQYSRAIDTLGQVPVEQLRTWASLGDPDVMRGWGSSGFDRLQDPRETAAELRRLTLATEGSGDEEAIAGALYDLMSYFYTRRNLLLYNPMLWSGGRSSLFGFWWNEAIATEVDNEAVDLHHREHEMLYRCIGLGQRLAERFPKTSWAPKALYRSACAARRLADFNPYWRARNQREDMWSLAIALMNRVTTEYPGDPLAPTAAKFAKVFEDERKALDGDWRGVDLHRNPWDGLFGR